MDDVKIYESLTDDVVISCRLCTQKIRDDRCWSIFETDLTRKIMAIAAVQIQENDGLPLNICTNCRNLVYTSYNFKCQVEKSDHDLREALLMKESPVNWSNNSYLKTIESMQMESCLQKDMTVQNGQFLFDMTNSCSVQNDDNFYNSVNTQSIMSEKSDEFKIGDNENNSVIVFDTHNEFNGKKYENVKHNSIKENSSQSDDEKPLILRTKRHKCNYCIKSFANLTLLEKHAVIHKKTEVIYVCYICDEQFDSIESVENHALTIHNIEIDRKRIIEDAKVKQVIDKSANNNPLGDRTENKSYFSCDICFRRFTTYKLYYYHMKTHPDIRKALKNSNAENVEKSTVGKNTRAENTQLDDTKENKSRNDCNINNNDYDNDDEDDDDDSSDEKQNMMLSNAVQCNQCGKLVSTKKNLRRHMLTHSGLKYNCTICEKDFSRPDKLKEHKKSKHKDEICKSDTDDDSDDEKSTSGQKKGKKSKPYKCSLCPKAFVQAQSLSNHEERHRKAKDVPKRYLCEICSKVFAQSGSLVAHMRTHTGVKPYVCNICSRAFTKSTYLQLHLRTHSGEKPYICQYCNKAFARANTLARHITVHTGEAKYHCQICKKSFRRLTSLNEHMYTHTGQRPYGCKICGKRYNNAGSLYAHTKKCKANQAAINPVSQEVTENTNELENTNSIESVNTNSIESVNTNASHIFIFTDKKMDDILTDDAVVPESACQFMIANIQDPKILHTNIVESFIIPESEVFNINTKQLKTSYYGLYPSL